MASQQNRDSIAAKRDADVVGSLRAGRRFRWQNPRLVLGVLVACLTLNATAASDLVRARQADPATLAASVESGRRLATFCFNCHGEDGHSRTPETPNIAGQNAVYLHEQIRKFVAGERRNAFMEGLMRALSEDERVNVAIYFAAQRALPAATNGGPQAANGATLFRTICASCHGDKGHGREEIPRIAGQHGIYLTRALSAYRAKDGTRGDPRMSAAAAALSDRDIAALAAYLSTLP